MIAGLLRQKLRDRMVEHETEAEAGPSRHELDRQQAELARCAQDFRHFLRYWTFINRETGKLMRFENLWEGQERAVDAMLAERWLFLLKAGKLGFTELECAYDGWVARFGPENARVHLFSRGGPEARNLLTWVSRGLRNLPEWMRLPVYEGRGGDTATQLTLVAGEFDHRVVTSYAARPGVSMDQTATHVHLDELSAIQDPKGLWGIVQTTVAPDGTCHIVTRGAGEGVYTAELWRACHNNGGRSLLYGHFSPWDARPRPEGWREQQLETIAHQALLYYAPITAEDALAGDAESIYIPMEVWDRLADPELPMPVPGSMERTDALVLGCDAGVNNDFFGIVAASRHPTAPDDAAAIRFARMWEPVEQPNGRVEVDFADVERWLRWVCEGGCRQGHPRSYSNRVDHVCELCNAGVFEVPPSNVAQLAYDPYQLEDMMQRFRADGVAWCQPFPQGAQRLEADQMLRRLAMQGRLVHKGDATLREHVNNAKAQVNPKEETRLRIVKRAESAKIDLAVAASMAVNRVMTLNL